MFHVVVYAAVVWAAVTAVLLLVLGVVTLLQRTGCLHPPAELEGSDERERISEAFTQSAQTIGWGTAPTESSHERKRAVATARVRRHKRAGVDQTQRAASTK
jgi:heme exporter protein D